MAKKAVSFVDVFLFVPNLIGFARVALLVASFWYALGEPVVFLGLYTASFLLDAADGHAARLLGQTSQFGAVLDMVTDRLGTNALLLVLSHLYSSMLAGSSSHKNASPDRDGHLLTLYYTNRIVLGGVCLFNEFFFIGLYAYAHFQPSWLRLAVALIAPVFAFKQYLSLIQLWNSCKIVATHDANERNKQ